MAHKNVWGDLGDQFGEIVEQGGQAAKQVVKTATVGVAKQLIKEVTGTSFFDAQQKKEGQKNPQNYTNLDEEKLKQIEGSYKKQDDVQLEQMRQRLFNMVNESSKRAADEAEQKEKERLQAIEEETMMKKREEEESNQGGLPMPSSKTSRGKMANKQAMKQATNATEQKSGNKQ